MEPASPGIYTCLLLAGAYLLGSIPFAYVIGRLLGIDIRKTGSRNIGATNLARSAGRSWGLLAFFLDFGKGLLPVLLARHLSGSRPEGFLLTAEGGLEIAAGLAAILGHVFPVYLLFRGGKGVATAFGVMAGLSWLATLVAGGVWAAVYLSTRTVSLASIAAALALPLTVALFERARSRSGFIALLAFTAAVSALIIVRHRSNLVRLIRGKELKFH